jgi:ribosomal protein S27AE
LRRWRLPDPIVRLAIVFVVTIAALLALRARFVPESFGDLGHYRAEAVEVVAAQPARYAGLQPCADCHTDQAELKARSYHRGLTCEGCHGPASAHVEDPTAVRPLVRRERDACARCHSYLASRPTGFRQVLNSLHNPVRPCIACHDPHDPTPPHVPSSCSACHAAIARIKAVSHHWSLDCETCHATPAEHRLNPRAHLPGKPNEREFCGRCHGQGSPGPSEAPRVDLAEHGGRYLCWQCHYPHFPEGR